MKPSTRGTLINLCDYSSPATFVQGKSDSFNFNLEQMSDALESPKIVIPAGLTNDQRFKFILKECGLGEEEVNNE